MQVNSSGSPSLINANYTVKEAGYAFVFVSNENATIADVYFDDVTMTYTPTNVIQYAEYYPFGLSTQNSWTRENNSNNFLYNEGSEMNTVSGFYDLPFRNYDAALGRFFQVDPLSARDHNITPFAYAGNNPIVNNDPSGLMTDYSTCWCNPDYAYQRQVDAENRVMLANSSWSSGGGGKRQDPIEKLSQAIAAWHQQMSAAYYSSDDGYSTSDPGEITAILQAQLDGTLYVGQKYFSIPAYEKMGETSNAVWFRDTGNSTWIAMGQGESVQQGLKVFASGNYHKNFHDAMDYMNDLPGENIGFVMKSGKVAVLPKDGTGVQDKQTRRGYFLRINGKWDRASKMIVSGFTSGWGAYPWDATSESIYNLKDTENLVTATNRGVISLIYLNNPPRWDYSETPPTQTKYWTEIFIKK